MIESLAELTADVFPSEDRVSVAVERVQVAALVLAGGDHRRLDEALALGRADWRDLLVAAGLAEEGWRSLVEAELAPAPAAHIWTARRRHP